jgi:hypothetical protein
MALAPQLDAPDLVGSAKIVAVTGFAQPPSLAGGLAGLATRGLGTIPLAIVGAWIRKEKLSATTAFTSHLRAAHREPDLEATPPGRKRKRRTRRR